MWVHVQLVGPTALTQTLLAEEKEAYYVPMRVATKEEVDRAWRNMQSDVF